MAPPKFTQNNLLLSTTYTLNASSSKQLVIGVEIENGENFIPVVRLESPITRTRITFTIEEWTSLMKHLQVIDDYFIISESVFKPVIEGEIRIFFTTSYGMSTLSIERRQEIREFTKKIIITLQKGTFDCLKCYPLLSHYV